MGKEKKTNRSTLLLEEKSKEKRKEDNLVQKRGLIAKEINDIYESVDSMFFLGFSYIFQLVVFQSLLYMKYFLSAKDEQSLIEDQAFGNTPANFEFDHIQTIVKEARELILQGKVAEGKHNLALADDKLNLAQKTLDHINKTKLPVSTYGGLAFVIFYPMAALYLIAIMNQKIVSPLFNSLFPIQKFLKDDFLTQQKDEILLNRKLNELRKYSSILRNSEYFLLSTITAVFIYNIISLILTAFSLNRSEFANLFEPLLKLLAQSFALTGYSAMQSNLFQKYQSDLRVMHKQLHHFLFNHEYKWQVYKHSQDELFSTRFSFQGKKVTLHIHGDKYFVSKKKFFSELGMLLFKAGYVVTFDENSISIEQIKTISNMQLFSLVSILVQQLIPLGNLSAFKIEKLNQLNLISEKILSNQNEKIKWKFFKLTDEKTKLPIIKYIANITAMDVLQRQQLMMTLAQFYGEKNITCDQERLIVTGYDVVKMRVIERFFAKMESKEQKLDDDRSSNQQNKSSDQANSYHYFSFWNSKKESNKSTSKPFLIKHSKEEDNAENNNNNNNNDNSNASLNKISQQLDELKKRYPGKYVNYHKADWLPKDQVYFTVLDYKKMQNFINTRYKKGECQDATSKLERCVNLIKQANGRKIKSNNPKNQDKSHTVGFFHTGREAVTDINGVSRLSSFKVKTDDNARLHGDVVKKKVNGEEVSVIKLRSFNPNSH